MSFIWILMVITNVNSKDHQIMVGAYKTPNVCESRAKEYNGENDYAACIKVEVRP